MMTIFVSLIKIRFRFYNMGKENDIAKANKSDGCIICDNFFNHGFKFQDSVCNVCHGLAMLRINLSDIAIITSLAKWLNIHLRTKWFWVRIPMLPQL